MPKGGACVKRRWIAWTCALLLLSLLGGCAPQRGDYLAPFSGEFAAQIVGEWNGLDFEAALTATAPDESGTRMMTLTFYAPSTLSGTVLSKDAQGVLTLAREGVCLPLCGTAAAGYGALFSLFPTEGEVQNVTQENGNTRLNGAGFSLLFAPDGTPLAAENDTARVTVTAFEN